jgi:hypothetical protein
MTTMTSPDVKISPCVRLFIELLLGGIEGRETKDVPIMSMKKEFHARSVATVAQEKFALRT